MIKYSIYIKCANHFELLETKSSYQEALDDLDYLKDRSNETYKILLSEEEVINFQDASFLEVQKKLEN